MYISGPTGHYYSDYELRSSGDCQAAYSSYEKETYGTSGILTGLLVNADSEYGAPGAVGSTPLICEDLKYLCQVDRERANYGPQGPTGDPTAPGAVGSVTYGK